MVSKYLIILILVIFSWSPLSFALAPVTSPSGPLNVEEEIQKITELLLRLSKVPISHVSREEGDRVRDRLRREFIPSLASWFSPWGLKFDEFENGAITPIVINALQSEQRQDYRGTPQNKVTFQVRDRHNDVYTVVFSPQDSRRDPALAGPNLLSNYISVFDKLNRKVPLRKLLYCQEAGVPIEKKISILGEGQEPRLPVPSFFVSRIGGEDGVSLEAINRIKILLRKAERLEKEGKVGPGYKIHIITGDYEKNPYLESLVQQGKLKICQIPTANPDKRIASNQSLFYSMFGINNESEKEQFIKDIQDRVDQIKKYDHVLKKLDKKVEKLLKADHPEDQKEILDKLYGKRFEIAEKRANLIKQLEEKKAYYRKKGKKGEKKALAALQRQADQVYKQMKVYLDENPDIEVAFLENASLPFYQAKLFKAAFQAIKERNYSTVVINHDWPDDRTDIYDFDSVLEGIKEVFLEEFFPHFPQVSYGSINERDKRKYYQRRRIFNVTNVGNVFDAEKEHEEFKRVEELRETVLGKEHKDDFVVLLPVRPVGRKRIDVALMKIALLKQLREKEGKPFPVSVVVSHSEKDAHPQDELEPLKELAEIFGINLVFGAEPIVKYNEEHSEKEAFELFDQYHMADFVDYSSDFEGFGNALLETLYFKVPVSCNRYEVLEQDILPKGFDFPSYKVDPTFKYKDFVKELKAISKENPDKKKAALLKLYNDKVLEGVKVARWLNQYMDDKEQHLSENSHLKYSGLPGENLPASYKEQAEKNFKKLLENYSFQAGDEILTDMMRSALGSLNIENVDDSDPNILILFPVKRDERIFQSA